MCRPSAVRRASTSLAVEVRSCGRRIGYRMWRFRRLTVMLSIVFSCAPLHAQPEVDAVELVEYQMAATANTQIFLRREGSACELGRVRLRAKEPVTIHVPRGFYQIEMAHESGTQIILLDGTRETTLAFGSTMLVVFKPLKIALLPNLVGSRWFNLYDTNYFLSGGSGIGADATRPRTEYSNQVKFRVAVRYRLFASRRCTETSAGLYATYGQRSFWHLYDQNAPFFDNNYNPGLLYVVRPYRDDLAAAGNWLRRSNFNVLLAYQHESNGRDSSASRGWDRAMIGLSLGDAKRSRVSGSLVVWKSLRLDEHNPDIVDWAGRAETRLIVNPPKSHWSLPRNVQWTSRILGQPFLTNAELALLWGSGDRRGGIKPDIMLQIFRGSAESLLDLRARRTIVRAGFALLQ